MKLYFAYGSNIYSKQMEIRCPTAEYVGIGRVYGYSARFVTEREFWEGGVVSAVRSPGGSIEGALYLINDKDLKVLDVFQGADVGESTRVEVPVETPMGSLENAYTYFFGRPVEGVNYMPSKKYLDRMIEGIVERGLSKDTLDFYLAYYQPDEYPWHLLKES